MPTEENAKKVCKDTRDFFKLEGGLKSGNKLFYTSNDESGVPSRTEGKHATRYGNFIRATKALVNLRKLYPSVDPPTPWKIGTIMVQQSCRFGNCHEMCFVSTKYAADIPVNSWVVEIQYPGDHVFCVLADQKPAWTSLTNMATSEAADVWIVDAWAKLYSTPNNYLAQLLAKFDTWAGLNKRVSWQKATGGKAIMVHPSFGEYQEATKTSALKYTAHNENWL